ncbi:MAG: MFS transporter [Rhodocyclaceae bacterium]|nr:MFS transporter [Rhodocyclaceae bacterium]
MAILIAEADSPVVAPDSSRTYAWVVFALSFGLLLSDYMSRQVLNAVFPLLKAEWSLSDTQLGSLSSIVALLVGLLTFPLSVVADRWGRVRSVVLMAALWSLATLGCALAANYGQMFIARFCVGVGEAAYGSVGIALVLSLFPKHMRASLSSAFMAGGPFGSVMGMALGGYLAVHLGWRWSFGAMALFGSVLVTAYFFIVSEKRLALATPGRSAGLPVTGLRSLFSGLFSSRSVVSAYIGSGLQLSVIASLMAWLPSYFNRYYGLAPDKAGGLSALFILIGAVGMVVCGIMTDRLCRATPSRKWVMAMGYSVTTFVLLTIAFLLPAGPLQLVVIGLGMLLAAGTTGPAGAMVANLTPAAIHSTAFATLTLANNLLGLAPGPFITGLLADKFGLLFALQVMPLAPLLAMLAFAVGKRSYAADLERLNTAPGQTHT